jgi:hypothetical protein
MADCSGLALATAAATAEASVVKPSIMRSREARVKTAIRVPGGMCFTYCIICWRTYDWSGMGVLSASSSTTFAALVSAKRG